MNRQPSSGVRILQGFLAFFLSLALFFSVFPMIALSGLRWSTRQDSFRKTVTDLLGTKVEIYASEDDDRTVEADLFTCWVFSVVEESADPDLGITLEDVQKFARDSTIPDFIAEKSASLVHDLVTGEEDTSITRRELTELLEENAPGIKEMFGYSLSSAEIKAIADEILDSDAVHTLNSYGSQVFLDELVGDEDVMYVLRLLHSSTALGSALIVCAVLAFLLFLNRWSRFWLAMKDCGRSLLFGGLFFLIPCLIGFFALSGTVEWADEAIARGLSRGLLESLLPVAAILTGTGILLLIFGSRIGRRRSNSVSAAAPAEEVPWEQPANRYQPPVYRSEPVSPSYNPVSSDPVQDGTCHECGAPLEEDRSGYDYTLFTASGNQEPEPQPEPQPAKPEQPETEPEVPFL